MNLCFSKCANIRLSVTATIVFSALLSFLWFAAANAADVPTKRALLIGIDDYKAEQVSDLRGAVNDVMLMRSVLIGKFGIPKENIAILTNQKATRANILSAIRSHLIEPAVEGDVSILHYSGHGSQMRDVSGDEIDGWDETIVPHDSRTPGVFDISDDTLNSLLNELTKKTKNVTVILDSCNSGTGLRGAGNTVRAIPADLRTPPLDANSAAATKGSAESRNGISVANSNYVLIAGSRADQLSNETNFEGNRHGALTWFLAAALKTATSQTSYKDVMDSVRLEVSNRFPSQQPQLEGKGTDITVFGVDRIETQPYILAHQHASGDVKIEAGKLFGVHNDAILKVYPPNTVDFGKTEAIAKIRIHDAKQFSARGRIIEGKPIAQSSRAILSEVTFGDTPIPVFVAAKPIALMGAVREALETSSNLSLVSSEQDAQLIVRHDNDHVMIMGGDLENFVPPISDSDPPAAETIANRISQIARWLSILGLSNSSSGLSVKLTYRRADSKAGTPAPAAVLSDTKITYQVTNNSAEPLFITVLDVSSNGSVDVLYPTLGQRQSLPSKATLERDIEMYLPTGLDTVTDTLKVIASVQYIDPGIFEQGAFRKIAGDPLALFLADSVKTGQRASRPVQVETWTTTQKVLRIHRKQMVVNGYSFYFDDGKKTAQLRDMLSQKRSVCSQNDTDPSCVRLTPGSNDGAVFELTQAGSANIGRAFDEAYELQELTNARRVEPDLEVRIPGRTTNRGIEKRDVAGDDSHDATARDDHIWSLKQTNIAEAWDKIRRLHGVREGEEARGILIAHPDTGYREHPEIWMKNNSGVRPVDVSKGYNFYENRKDSKDPLLGDRFSDNPGHGTASGSVIVSPSGCQIQGTGKCVNGVARGARLIPLRVHRTVAQFNTKYLAKAINAVTDGKIQGDPKLISIAMGGPPSYGLWQAVKRAERKGILIIAASGNYVRKVVWPARYSSTIAVAANSVNCKHWKHSSHGDSIDISAPGESVWRASLNDENQFIVGMGKGTTFATGNVAGAAALWLSFHRDNPELQLLRERGTLTEVFRNALRESSWRPDTSKDRPGTYCDSAQWDQTYGPGILDVAELLKMPLTTSGTRPTTVNSIPLFSTLYPPGTDVSRITSDYLMIFGQQDVNSLQQLSKFEAEILHHYTFDETISQNVEQLVSGPPAQSRGLQELRSSLLEVDLSNRLREALAQ